MTERHGQVFDLVTGHGYCAMLISDPDSDEPDWGYSVGFPKSLGQGEVIVFGLSDDVHRHMICEVFAKCQGVGLRLTDGVRIDGLLQGFDVIARKVHVSNIHADHLRFAMWCSLFMCHQPLTEVYQLVWPSAATGLFPWEPGCHPDVIALQPALYEPRLNS
ncbi:DUF4262 domain-containing protein [Novosphingobium sp.]|uniref:DUF4262 domain-containing protein n=1 Tax=Novosphingobium sp. TaxID=1874826 RepID=UPI002638FC1C|nr:DUF4262 domain-containing protein [Novosphingobium sp.]